MANYPTSNPSFTTKQDGVDKPQAAHINLIQDEVVALGTALRTGLDHALTVNTGGATISSGGLSVSTGSVNIGGPSSVNTLQVNGASSFAGAMQVAGAASFSSAVSFGGAVSFTGSGTIYPTVPTCLLTHSVSVSISSAAWTGLNWDTEVRDDRGMHSTSVNSSRVTFVDSTGVYALTANVSLSSLTTGLWLVRLQMNDTTTVALTMVNPPASVSIASATISAPVRVASTTEYATVQVQTQSQASSVFANALQTPVSFGAVFVSK